ncbi:MAG TPA: VOC family protein [Geminicoccaceae bacterium]|nr:VOC family protein [Geminicoccaceae bacterium]
MADGSELPAPTGSLTPFLTVKNAEAAIAFYREAFGAVELFRLSEPSGKIGHAELRIGDALLLLNDEYPDFGALSPVAIGGSPVKLHLYVEDVDAVVARAVAAGATLLRPVKDGFYDGDRSGLVADPSGHAWFIATRKEEVTPAEMQRRWDVVLQAG